MREFYKDILENLYIYCGNRQVDKMDDKEITELLNSLSNVSKLFDYIPEAEQKAIIKKCLISDREYQNLNVRLIHKWLSENGKMYFKEEAHTPIQFHEPAPPEVAEKYIEQFKADLEKIGNPQKRVKAEILGESPALKSYFEGKQTFIIEGVEVKAKTLEEAQELYLKNFL